MPEDSPPGSEAIGESAGSRKTALSALQRPGLEALAREPSKLLHLGAKHRLQSLSHRRGQDRLLDLAIKESGGGLAHEGANTCGRPPTDRPENPVPYQRAELARRRLLGPNVDLTLEGGRLEGVVHFDEPEDLPQRLASPDPQVVLVDHKKLGAIEQLQVSLNLKPVAAG